MSDTEIVDLEQIKTATRMRELQDQRGFLGDRAVNMAAELEAMAVKLQMSEARVASLEKELEECRSKQQAELPLET